MKAALRSHESSNKGTWLQNLRLVMLGLRNARNNDLGSASQKLLGMEVRLPGDIILTSDASSTNYTPFIILYEANNKKHIIQPEMLQKKEPLFSKGSR